MERGGEGTKVRREEREKGLQPETQVSKIIWQKVASPSCHPSRRQMHSRQDIGHSTFTWRQLGTPSHINGTAFCAHTNAYAQIDMKRWLLLMFS